MKALTKSAILAAKDIKSVPHAVPEWGEDAGVYLIELSAAARSKIMATHQAHKDAGTAVQNDALRDAMFIACVADEKGKPLFAEADLPALRERNGNVIERIVKAALELNGMTAKEEDKTEKQ